jgi:predicted nuclease of predicted toxin-antitoxin system
VIRLLFDENLPPSLARRLQDLFPGSVSAVFLGLRGQDDLSVYAAASRDGFTIVTRDKGFVDWVMVKPGPPRVIQIRIGNASTDRLEALIREHAPVIVQLHRGPVERHILRIP